MNLRGIKLAAISNSRSGDQHDPESSGLDGYPLRGKYQNIGFSDWF
jgi:hypothetical protein